MFPANINNIGKSVGSLKIGKILGEGSYGTVHMATDSINGEVCAIKILNKNKMNSDMLLRTFFEADIMKQLKHKNILKAFHISEDTEHVYLSMEYAKNGDLLEYVNFKKRIQEDEAREIFTQLVNALEYTHNQNIIHRDIKLENILISEDNQVIIGDWGFADYWSIGKKIKCKWGSLFYAAPEVFLGVEYTGPEIDIWSLGVVLYAMITGKLPFTGGNNSEIASKILEGSFQIPNYVSKSLSNLLTSMLQVQPIHRISMKEIKTHKWMFATCTAGPRRVVSEDTIDTTLQRDRKSKLSVIFTRLLSLTSLTTKDQNKSQKSKQDRRKSEDEAIVLPKPRTNKRWSFSSLRLGSLKNS